MIRVSQFHDFLIAHLRNTHHVLHELHVLGWTARWEYGVYCCSNVSCRICSLKDDRYQWRLQPALVDITACKTKSSWSHTGLTKLNYHTAREGPYPLKSTGFSSVIWAIAYNAWPTFMFVNHHHHHRCHRHHHRLGLSACLKSDSSSSIWFHFCLVQSSSTLVG